MLLKAGAKPGLMDMEGKNALDYAESAECVWPHACAAGAEPPPPP